MALTIVTAANALTTIGLDRKIIANKFEFAIYRGKEDSGASIFRIESGVVAARDLWRLIAASL